MDWRRPIEQQKPVATPEALRDPCAERRPGLANVLPGGVVTGDDPELIELAFQAYAYTERLRREGRRL